jgi:hypothetical protein
MNHFAGKVVVGAQDNLMKARDERVALMNEVCGQHGRAFDICERYLCIGPRWDSNAESALQLVHVVRWCIFMFYLHQFMAWERSFEARVLKIRAKELKYQKLNYTIEVCELFAICPLELLTYDAIPSCRRYGTLSGKTATAYILIILI